MYRFCENYVFSEALIFTFTQHANGKGWDEDGEVWSITRSLSNRVSSSKLRSAVVVEAIGDVTRRRRLRWYGHHGHVQRKGRAVQWWWLKWYIARQQAEENMAELCVWGPVSTIGLKHTGRTRPRQMEKRNEIRPSIFRKNRLWTLMMMIMTLVLQTHSTTNQLPTKCRWILHL